MQINARLILVLLLIVSACLLEIHAKGGRGGGGSRGGGSRGRGSTSTRRRPTYRPASRPSPRPVYKPSPRPAPAPTPKATLRPQPAPTQRSQPAPASPKPSAPEQPIVAKQPAANPNFKETSHVQGSPDGKQPAANPNFKETSNVQGSPDGKQPAQNPNYKPEGGPPPPYSPAGHPAPSAPQGPPPPYQPSAPLGQPPPYGSPGQRPPYPQNTGNYPGQPPGYPGQSAPYPIQPPAYPGLPGRQPTYPGQSAPYPQQPGYPGGYPQQPGYPGSYPRQPGYPGNYPQQPGYPGNYPQQPGMNRPYPVQPGAGYPGGYRPFPQQPLGGNIYRPQSGMPAPPHMNYGGIPTGTNMYAQPHKKKGFLGSLMSMGHSKPKYGKSNKYGSYPSPYGLGGVAAGGMAGGFLGKHGKSAAMYSIMPFMAARAGSKMFRPRLGLGLGMMSMFMLMPMFLSHRHYGYGSFPRYAHYYDVYSNDYAGKCKRPFSKENTEVRCKSTYDDIKCDARCEDGFNFPENITMISNRCWHVTGIWRPQKNFPACTAQCDDECMNGGECIRPGICKCPAEYRGDRCQFHFLDCDVRKLTKNEKNLGWVCNHTKNETTCKIRCKPPAIFESPLATEEYKCTPQGVWTPNSLPRCTVMENKDGNLTVADNVS